MFMNALIMCLMFQVLNKSEDMFAIEEIANIMNVELDADGFPPFKFNVEELDIVTVKGDDIPKIKDIIENLEDKEILEKPSIEEVKMMKEVLVIG